MKRTLFISSIIVIFLIGIYLFGLKPKPAIQSQENGSSTFTIWVYSSMLSNRVEEYKKENPEVVIFMKKMKSAEHLVEELKLANSSGNTPDMAEIPSLHGIFPFVEDQSIMPVDEYVEEGFAASLIEVIKARFSTNENLYALPLGYEVPILYVNRNKYKDKLNIQTLQDLWEKSDSKKYILADAMYPWYKLNMLPPDLSETDQSKGEDLFFSEYSSMMALTDFVNGHAGVLISSSSKLHLLEKLIGSTFTWEPMAFPSSSERLLVNGSGLSVFQNRDASKETIQSFFSYVQEKDVILKMSVEGTLIPPIKTVAESEQYISHFRQYPAYQLSIKQSIGRQGFDLTSEDEKRWNQVTDE